MFSKINKRNFVLGLLMLIFVAFVLISNRQNWFTGSYPVSSFVKDYYVQNSVADTGAENSVTAIYLDYRLFDTLFETMLLFVSVIAVFYFSRHERSQE